MEMARRDAGILRREAIEGYNEAAASMEAWRKDYRRIQENHDRGRAPSVPSIVEWDLDCSRTDFDGQHLREAMRRSTQVVRKDKYVYEMLFIARDAGLEPLDWQHRAFSRSDPHYYTESQENALAAAAPFELIYGWGAGLPKDPEEMGGPLLPDAEHKPAGYGGDPEIEVPEDADLKSEKEPEPGDSASCRADDDTRATIRERQALERPG
ncbi:hypothetical protein LTR85_002570 [Meristemomyces frigidus]|nr:hypothetical protein LTR85_002570 [Meristemomyces frigidus]